MANIYKGCIIDLIMTKQNKLQELLEVIKSYESIIDLDEETEVMHLMADIQEVMGGM